MKAWELLDKIHRANNRARVEGYSSRRLYLGQEEWKALEEAFASEDLRYTGRIHRDKEVVPRTPPVSLHGEYSPEFKTCDRNWVLGIPCYPVAEPSHFYLVAL